MSHLVFEHVCSSCGEVFESDCREFECPRCDSERLQVFKYIECDCGERLSADGFTNECWNCGALYNGFGQRLGDPSEWDDEDRYASFGPQEYEYVF